MLWNLGSESEEEFVVTLGLVRTPGGMEAISLSSDGKAWIAAVVDADEVSKHWLADVVCASDLVPECPHPFDAFVWVIELMNGGLFCWSVPYLLYGDHYNDANDFQLSVFFQDATISRPKGLYPPTLICKKETREAKRRFLLGVLCHVGSSSDWMAQSSAGCQTDIAMGHVPQSLFGCVLRAGQEARKLHRESVEFDTDIFASDFLESDVYGPSDFMMMPPAFVPPLYSMFLEAAHLRTIIPVMEESKLDATSTMLQEESDRLEVCFKFIASVCHPLFNFSNVSIIIDD